MQNYISVEPRKEDGESSTTSTFEFEGETVLVDHCDCDTLAEACISSGDWNSEECETFKGADCEDCISAKTHCE